MANARGIAPRPWRSMNLHTAAPPNPSDPQTRKPRPARDDEREVVVQYSLSRRRQVQNEARIARLGSPPRSRRCDEPTPHAADCLDGRGPVAELAPDRAARRAAPGPRNHLHLGRVWAAGILSGRGRTQGPSRSGNGWSPTHGSIQINGGIVGGDSLLLSNNAVAGGTCFGDSGGPNFVGTLVRARRRDLIRHQQHLRRYGWRLPRRHRRRSRLAGADVWRRSLIVLPATKRSPGIRRGSSPH